jgi:pilus assembly protein Flp/PilA
VNNLGADETPRLYRTVAASGYQDKSMTRLLARFRRCESGATAIEYAFIAMLIALVIIVSVTTIGTSLDGTFTFLATELDP